MKDRDPLRDRANTYRHRAKSRGIDPQLVGFYLRVKGLIGGGNHYDAAVPITRWVSAHPPALSGMVLVVVDGGDRWRVSWELPLDVPYMIRRHTAAILIPATWIGGESPPRRNRRRGMPTPKQYAY